VTQQRIDLGLLLDRVWALLDASERTQRVELSRDRARLGLVGQIVGAGVAAQLVE